MKSLFGKRCSRGRSVAAAAICAGLLATAVLLPEARGELVYEGANKRAESREATRGVVRAAQRSTGSPVASKGSKRKARSVAIDASAPIPAVESTDIPAVEPESVAAQSAEGEASVDGSRLSKSELMRRERVREELRNEDTLQERLEELRLRDERRRTEQLLAVKNEEAPAAAPVVTPAPMQQEVVSAPESMPAEVESIGKGSKADVASDELSSSMASAAFESDEQGTTRVSLAPRAGLSTMVGNEQYQVHSRYSAGIGAGIEVTDNVGFELGYTYSEYGVAVNTWDPAVLNYQVATGNYGNPNFDTHAMKQNVFDAGVRVNVLGQASRIRPFVSGGAAYSKSYINFDNRITDAYRNVPGMQNMAADYEVSSFLGYLGTGADFRLSKNITVGGLFKYYTVLSARENQPLYYGGFNTAGYSPYYGAASVGPYSAANVEKAALGGSLARSSFYSILGTVSFTF